MTFLVKSVPGNPSMRLVQTQDPSVLTLDLPIKFVLSSAVSGTCLELVGKEVVELVTAADVEVTESLRVKL
jgi:hypothetical protein